MEYRGFSSDWCCRLDYLKSTPCIQLKNQKIKVLNVSSVIENSPKIKEEKFGLSVSAVLGGRTWTLRDRERKVHV